MLKDFSWFESLTGGLINAHNIHIVSAGIVFLLICIFAVLVHSKLKKVEERIVPSSKMSLVNIFEVAVEKIMGLIEGIIGADAPKYFPLLGAIFIYIFLSNALGLLPGIVPSTDNINTNLAISVTVFVYYNAMGIKAHGLGGYLKHFLGPILWLGPLVAVIEIIGHAVRPLSLALRLMGNIVGDHLVLLIFSNLTKLGIPVIFLALGLFVSFIQAFVFTLLSAIYLGLATAHGDGGEHGNGHGHAHH